MVRRFVPFVVVLGVATLFGCSSETRTDGAANAPCTRSKDCAAGLVCSDGVCEEPFSSALDAGSDASAAEDGAAADGGR